MKSRFMPVPVDEIGRSGVVAGHPPRRTRQEPVQVAPQRLIQRGDGSDPPFQLVVH